MQHNGNLADYVASPYGGLQSGSGSRALADAGGPGWDLDPPVPNPLPFGHPPLTIDLMRAAPSPAKDFELAIHVLDTSSFGSTTDIWVIPR